MADAEPEVRFGLLGPVLAGYGGALVDLPSVRQRMVLAALLLRPNQTINVQDLASLIWDGTSPEQAAMTLRSYVMRLRRSLGPELGARIKTRSPGYVVEIRHESELDTLHFAELRRCSQAAAALSDWEGAADWLRAALALWRGAPLEDVPESAPGIAELPGLLEGKIQAHEALAEAELQLGRPGGEASAAVNRLVSWYTHVVSRADLVLSPGRRAPVQPDPVAGLGPLPEFGSAAEAIQCCDGEHANLVAAALLARASGLNRLAWQLPLALWGFLHLRGHFADWIVTHESALAAATEAIALLRTERIGEATVHLEAAIGLNLELGNPASAAAALNNLAIATVEDGRPDDAIGYLHRAIEHRRASGDKRGEAYSQANLGETYFRTGRTAEAIPRYHAAISLYRESGSGGEAPAQVLYNLAVAHAELGESDLARARGAESAQTSRDVADHQREGEVLEWLGGVSPRTRRAPNPLMQNPLMQNPTQPSRVLPGPGLWIARGAVRQVFAQLESTRSPEHLVCRVARTVLALIVDQMGTAEQARDEYAALFAVEKRARGVRSVHDSAARPRARPGRRASQDPGDP